MKKTSKATVPVKSVTLEVVSAEPQTVAAHNLYHRNGMLTVAQAACWFVLAGAELKRQKKSLKHGQWETWVEQNCEFGDRTSRRYIALYEAVKNKALKAATKDVLLLGDRKTDTGCPFWEMLEKPASVLTEADQLMLLKSVYSLTDGATIMELYEDFGIVKKVDGRSKNPGGFRPSKELTLEWLSVEYPENPEYLGCEFDELPQEVQERFCAEGPRYKQRLTIEQKAELETAAKAQRWLHGLPPVLKEGLVDAYWERGTDEQLTALADLLHDLHKGLQDQQRRRTSKRPALRGARA